MPNALQYESSPYLLQHANNPVEWYPWGNDAIEKAKKENKPILVSIGYAACHWCHVMEHESFENETTASIMNQYFINIKIDREERPDIDHIYMDAVQAMTGSGGWPLNVFLTPTLKPFYGGTYFPPTKMHNRSSWIDVLMGVHTAWQERSNELEAQAEELTAHLFNANSFGTSNIQTEVATEENLVLINHNILKNADELEGGFGNAPKFPQFHSITYLLRHFHFFKEEKSLQHAILSLQKMIEGGIYDQLGGGLARYSTDNNWLVPHFEKMLYDNALFVQTLSEVYQITKNELFKTTIEHTIDFLKKDLMHDNFLFYAAIDADSEGVEGKYYCWTEQEINAFLTQEEASIFNKFYNVSKNGNWIEPHHQIHTNILHQKITIEALAKQFNKDLVEVENSLKIAKSKLLHERYKRVPPLTDDKCLLSWNALMNKALVKAYQALSDNHYLELAKKNYHSILKNYIELNDQGEIVNIFHSYKGGKASIDGFLEDVAFLLDALFELYNCTLDNQYLNTAKSLLVYIDIHFSDSESPFYFFTKKGQENIIIRKKEIYDGATPSGNSIMANLLWDAAIYFENIIYQQKSIKMVQNLSNLILKHPSSFSIWACLQQKMFFYVNEISLSIDDTSNNITKINNTYLPYKVIKNSNNLSKNEYSLCRNNICLPLFNTINDLFSAIKENEKKLLKTK